MKTKDKLLRLFEYQKYERNKELDAIINEAIKEDVQELNDNVLVAATGGVKKAIFATGDIVSLIGTPQKFYSIVSIKEKSVLLKEENSEQYETASLEEIVK